jgi:predicted amidohydrolase YtcJ
MIAIPRPGDSRSGFKSGNAQSEQGRAALPPKRTSRVYALALARCATANVAYLAFDQDRKGLLEPGKLTDLAVPSAADLLTVGERGLAGIRAHMTMVGARMVHETPNWLE